MPKDKPKKKPEVDARIMAELLAQDGVREHVEAMTPEELEWYKDLLVSQGIYATYVKERETN